MVFRAVARAAFSLACVVALGALLACPKPVPPVVNPSPPAGPANCDNGCKNAETVCPGSGSPCLPACNRIGADYARCLGAATSCSALKGCDPLSR